MVTDFPEWLDRCDGFPYDKRNLWFNVKQEPTVTLSPGKYILGLPETILPDTRFKKFKKNIKVARAKNHRCYRDKAANVYVFDNLGESVFIDSVLTYCDSRIIALKSEPLILCEVSDINPGRLKDVCRLTFKESANVYFIRHGKEDYIINFKSTAVGRPDLCIQRL